MKMAKFMKMLLAWLVGIWIVGCAANPQMAQTNAPTAVEGEQEIRRGTITRIDPVDLEGDHQLGVGAVMGAAVGGLVGHQIGEGNGRTVATVLGALGGGVLGNRVQNKYADKQPGSHVMVKLDNGVTVAVTQPADPTLRVGDRVTVQGSGQDARVLRA
jgi:outer membrane lipoprotein SlyB